MAVYIYETKQRTSWPIRRLWAFWKDGLSTTRKLRAFQTDSEGFLSFG